MSVNVPSPAPAEQPGGGLAPSTRWVADAYRVALVRTPDRRVEQNALAEDARMALAETEAQVTGRALAAVLRDAAVTAIQQCMEATGDPAEDASWLMSVATVHCRIRQAER